uniref:Glycosyltransferase RgtA/B/C/D-like domain-containing protein n=1 Tax=Fundidesulfovibrio putealis TaxID=270496 RepID=A0A7C4AAQ6_9BACT
MTRPVVSSWGLSRSRDEGARWPVLAAWCCFIALALFFLFYLTPRKGAFFSDEGWYLYNALRALRHGELDLFLPQAPSYLVNTAFMTLLGEGYLPLRWAYTLCSLLAGAAVMAGVGRGEPPMLRALPLGLSCVLVAGLSSLVNYQNGPTLFLMLGLGLNWLADGLGAAWAARAARLGAGLALACSAMVNLTVAPGLVLVCLWLLWTSWRDHDLGRALVPVSCGVFLAAMLGAYLYALGWQEMFRVPKGHGFHYGRILEILALCAVWPGCWSTLYVMGRISGGGRGRFSQAARTMLARPALWGLGLATLAAALHMAKAMLVIAAVSPPFPLTLLATVNPVIILPQYAYAVFCLAVFSGDKDAPQHRRGVFCALALLVYWAQQTFYSDVPVNFSMVFASGYMMALGLGLLSLRSGPGDRAVIRLGAAFFVGCCVYFLFTGGWTTENTILGPKAEVDHPRFRGILESPERVEMFARLKKAYDECGCADKTLVSFRNTSLLYYFLDHKAPERLSYMSQNFGMYREEVRRVLDAGGPWCVFYSENIKLISNKAEERELLDMVEARASRRLDLGNDPPRHLYDDFVVFTGPKAEPERKAEPGQ